MVSRPAIPAVLAGLLPVLGGAADAAPDPSPPATVEVEDVNDEGGVIVEADHPTDSPSTRRLDRAAIEAMPGSSADELLRAMPGLHVSRHGGRGKAMQFFLRGFDAVHGADLSVRAGDVPLNEVSHVHAHGYLDLYVLPPLLVRGLTVRPGVRRASDGDFAVAGAATFDLGLDRSGAYVQAGGGTDTSGTVSATYRPPQASAASFAVVDAELGEGVGPARDWRQLRAAVGHGGTVGELDGQLWVLAYDGRFSSPGVVREDDVEDGIIDLRGAYPGSGGGRSRRVLAAGVLAGGDATRAWRATAWAGARSMALTQNYTGSYEDPVHGDATRQGHRAGSGGVVARVGRTLGPRARLRGGSELRVDRVHHTHDRVDLDGRVWDRDPDWAATQAAAGAWVAADTAPARWLELEPGLRVETFWVEAGDTPWSVTPVLAPSLSLTGWSDRAVTPQLAYARSFRSPDARSVGSDGNAEPAVADSAEAGLRASPVPWLTLRAVGFATTISDEIVFDHVEARYLATGATLRRGVDLGVSVQPSTFVRLEADLTQADGRYSATGTPIPYAPRQLATAGVYVEALSVGAGRCTLGVRGWHLGPRALPDGFAAPAATVLDATAQLDWSAWQLSLDVDNVLGADWWDGSFVYPSQWSPRGPRSELPVRHITTGSARVLRVALGRSFG